jgi:hypothetical protein
MKVAIDSIEVTDDDLKSIRRAQNQHGKATRAEAKIFISNLISSSLIDLKETYPPNKRPQQAPAPTPQPAFTSNLAI